MRIVTISFTPLNAGGGVPKFNRDLHSAFAVDHEVIHYSWWDFPWYIEAENQPEWEKARTLNHYLLSSGKIRHDDVVIADGFWADGLQHLKYAVSHSHGIWSHLTKDDVDAGKQPENPFHHAAQVAFRQRWLGQKKHMTAVSEFIYKQMELQWGFKADCVINNGVDTKFFTPGKKSFPRKSPIIVHGVNDRSNVNKGWDHIEKLISGSGCEVFSFDEMIEKVGSQNDIAFALAEADLVVHPSGYEGNSMFVAEALSCGLPFVGYDVGAMYSPESNQCGIVLPRSERSPESTLAAVKKIINDKEMMSASAECARRFAENELSLTNFKYKWREYVRDVTTK